LLAPFHLHALLTLLFPVSSAAESEIVFTGQGSSLAAPIYSTFNLAEGWILSVNSLSLPDPIFFSSFPQVHGRLRID
jgi:hypothetical protein